MQTDALTLRIYDEIVKFYIEQVKLNVDLVTDIETERKLHKLPYAFHNKPKQIIVETFSCKFTDVFDIKQRYDKLLKPKERFFYFKQPVIEAVQVIIPAPDKPKRSYKPRVKPPILRLPRVSILKQVLMYFKAA